MKRKIGVLICMALVLSMTFAVAAGQNVEKDDYATTNCRNNSPPSDPVLTGPDSVIKNRLFVIDAVSNDPEDDQIYYRFKIGEDSTPRSWNGPYNSGYEFNLRVRLIGYTGDLVIGFQAKDTYGAESDWSYHTITYTNARSRTFVFDFLLGLFPQLSRLLNL